MGEDEDEDAPDFTRSLSSSRQPRRQQIIYAGGVCASSMGEHEFSMRQPLVSVRHGAVSKFRDGKLIDKEVGDYLLKRVIREMQKFGKCYSAAGFITKELCYRPVVSALFPIFSSLAPRAGELLEGEDPKYKASDSEVVFMQTSAGMQMEDEGAGDGDDMSASFMSDATDLSGWSFVGGRFHHEDGTSLKPHEAVDVRGYVVDQSLLGSPSLPRCLFEAKGLGGWLEIVRQVLYYGCAAAIENVRAGRFKKVYLVVLGIGWLGCAEVDPVGCLDVGPKNSLSLATIASFKKQVEAKRCLLQQHNQTAAAEALKKYSQMSDHALRDYFLEEMKKEMGKAAFKLNTRAGTDIYAPLFVKPARLLVGQATFRRDTFNMLQFPLDADSVLKEDFLVVSGIARVIFGDRVLRWKLPALLAHAARRDAEADLEVEHVMARH